MKTLDINDCAEFLKIDRSTALRLAGTGALPGAKVGRAWVFLEEDLVEYLRAAAREQSRRRQAEAAVVQELGPARLEQAMAQLPSPRGRRRRGRPVLPEAGSQVAATKVGIAS